jgi:UDP-N-acetylglucosamine--N-acetylmuramyl-(pentapeptide) pyrophosphoryl-undecaprenol N-acetylglucosamine transferase
MEYAYTAADVVISRSGAMSVSELCIVAKPVVFVPYPHAAENHQTANAEKLVSKNAALMIEDKLALTNLIPAVIELTKDNQQQEIMRENIKKISISNADEIVANEILNYLNQ